MQLYQLTTTTSVTYSLKLKPSVTCYRIVLYVTLKERLLPFSQLENKNYGIITGYVQENNFSGSSTVNKCDMKMSKNKIKLGTGT